MQPKTHPVDLLALQYAQRHLIAVYPDNDVIAIRSGAKPEPNKSASGWTPGRIGRMIVLGPIWSIPAEKWIEGRKNDRPGLDVLYASDSEISKKGVKFPPGHPRRNTLYAAHPTASGCYYALANFHRMTFEHKFAEVLRLLMALGATAITVEHKHGWSHKFAASMSVPVPEEKVTVGLGAGQDSSSSAAILFEASLDGTATPHLPDGLSWYQHESLWQEIARGRLERGMKKFALELTYNDDFGINAELTVKAKDAGMEIGGSFEKHTETVWKIRGEFGAGKAA